MSRHNHRSQRGFTIVELLIVIVVIGILATITVVAYKGVQQRANIAVAQSDLRAIAAQMELYKADNGTYPDKPVDGNYREYEKILQKSNLYDKTRWSGETTTRAKRGYAFCLRDDVQSGYTIFAFEPIYTFLRATGPSYVGKPLYYVSEGANQGSTPIQWDGAIETASPSGVVGKNMCKSIDPDYNPAQGVVWSYSIPTPYAP
ncbi:MAG: prepilin-type N-terminal cleavage/methylation domain-containing protein [Candidatus Saccharimonadales bacterium]